MFQINFGTMVPPTFVKLETWQLIASDITKEYLHLRLLLGKFLSTSISVSVIDLSL